MTPREIMIRTIEFRQPERLALNLPEPYTDDMVWISMDHDPDRRFSKGVDEWGCVWDNIGVCRLGEVKDMPIKTWDDFKKMTIPDITDKKRWESIDAFDKSKTDKFVLSSIMSLYERSHFLRGLENLWADLYENPDQVKNLLNILTEMNLYAIERYAKAGSDGVIFCDDWGLQNALMISPAQWREFFKPNYARIFKKAHDCGMKVFMHSCGYILEILEELVSIGLDVAQLDQQLNMGLEALSAYKGRLTFWCPVDIQSVMPTNNIELIREYTNKMVNTLSDRPNGGFIGKIYPDPNAVGHTALAVDEMCKEFEKISKNWK